MQFHCFHFFLEGDSLSGPEAFKSNLNNVDAQFEYVAMTAIEKRTPKILFYVPQLTIFVSWG